MTYKTFWRNKWLTADAQSIEDMIRLLRSAADELDEMRQAGVKLDPDGGTENDYAVLVTEDKQAAERFGLVAWCDECGDEMDEGEDSRGLCCCDEAGEEGPDAA